MEAPLRRWRLNWDLSEEEEVATMRGGRKEWGKRNADRGSTQCKNLACSRSRKRSQRGWHPVVEGKEGRTWSWSTQQDSVIHVSARHSAWHTAGPLVTHLMTVNSVFTYIYMFGAEVVICPCASSVLYTHLIILSISLCIIYNFCSHFRWGNQSLMELNILPRVAQPATGTARIWM